MIRDTPIPDGYTGFVKMLSIDQETNLDLWEMNDLFNRHSVSPVSSVWRGTYPYDVPSSYDDPSKYFYYPLPDGFRYHAVHLHRLQRSRFDYNVVKRIEKQKLFCLKDLPIKRTIPFSILEWTRS